MSRTPSLIAALVSFTALTLGCSDAPDPATVQPTSAGQAQTAASPARVASPAGSSEPTETLADWVRNARSGSLVLRAQTSGKLSAGPALATVIDVKVTGLIARASVQQKFANESDDWVEGIYVFPLPDDAAVDHMRILTDGRVIEGQIQEKEEARKTYEAAKAEGKRAGLVEQERPNVFTTRIANIRPKSEVTIEIEYQQSVRLDDGAFSIRIPTVVAPRYLPGETEHVASPASPASPFEIAIDLAPGFDAARVESPYHEITHHDDGHSYQITLADGPVPADRDFVLEWKPATGQDPEAIVYTEAWGGDTYALLLVVPPFEAKPESPGLAREVVYVVDTSGSMAGASMIQAKAALAFALERLTPDDRFNVIEFDNETRALFEKPQPAYPANIGRALDSVAGLQASGGTDIAPAIRRALEDDGSNTNALRQVVFLTDGSVGNETELLEELKKRMGKSRVFAIGIGPAPNSFFMRKLGQLGRGTFTHIGDPAEVAEKMTGLFRKLESAVIADIAIEMPEGTEVEMYPYEVPDLYLGEPVLVALKLDAPLGETSVKGWKADTPWQVNLSGWAAEERPGIHVLWARQAIEERMDDRLGTRDEKLLTELRAEAVELAIDHHLVSAYTSLVAVDVTPERYADQKLSPHQLGTKLPAGWQADSALGFAQGSTPATLHIGIGLLLMAAGAIWRRGAA